MKQGINQKTNQQLIKDNMSNSSKEGVFRTQGNQVLLDKKASLQNRYSTFQIDGSHQKKSEETSRQMQRQNHKNSFIQSQQETCYPKFLSWLGNCISPCLVCCPCCRCRSCCQNLPLFQQPVSSFGLLQRWGSYQKLLNPGLHVINPISQRIIEINRQTKVIQVSQIAFTKDNVQFKADSVIFYRVIDSLKLAYKLGIQQSQCRQVVAELAQACLRNLIGTNTLQNVIQKRQSLSNHLKDDLNQNLSIWGIYIQACNLKQIILSQQIREYLQSTAKAKRMMQAQIINYQAQVEVGKLIKEVSQILNTKAAFQIRYLDTIGTILQKNPNTVIMIKTEIEQNF